MRHRDAAPTASYRCTGGGAPAPVAASDAMKRRNNSSRASPTCCAGVRASSAGRCNGEEEKQQRADELGQLRRHGGEPGHEHQRRLGEPGQPQRRVVMVLPVLLVVVALGEGAGTCFCGGCSSKEDK